MSWATACKGGLQAGPVFVSTLQQVALAAVGFVERVACMRAQGDETRVRSLSWGGENWRVAYSLRGRGAHYCGNVGRAHRSNTNYIVVDYEHGVVAARCFDPDCARWCSEWTPLPHEVWRQHELIMACHAHLLAA
ncbi:hypothetical protein V8C86DRAFT_2613894 [Haematococcus lacustris]